MGIFRARIVRLVTIVLGLPLVYAACGARQTQSVVMQTKFDSSEHEPYTKPGENGIRGQGFLRQQGGGVVTCAGSQVLLLPATPFFREMIGHIVAGRKPDPPEKIGPPLAAAVTRRSQCDAQGNFSFAKIPDGAWFVVTQVSWIVANVTQGGTLIREMTLSKHETVQVLLTEKNLVRP